MIYKRSDLKVPKEKPFVGYSQDWDNGFAEGVIYGVIVGVIIGIVGAAVIMKLI